MKNTYTDNIIFKKVSLNVLGNINDKEKQLRGYKEKL